jgi:regulator of nucleoside diphosphate kinase
MTASLSRLARPPIVLCVSDRDALERAALGSILEAPRVAGPLLEEVDRAAVVADRDLGGDVVRLGSSVIYRDDLTGDFRRVRLVLSATEDCGPGELSVLTPEGAALVGLREGQSISWSDRRGAERPLTVVSATFARTPARMSPSDPSHKNGA